MQERLAIRPADPAAAGGERLLNWVGGKRHRSFEKAHMNRFTSPLAQIMSPLENWSGVDKVTEKNDATVAFLLLGDASYITGASISVAHGYLAT